MTCGHFKIATIDDVTIPSENDSLSISEEEIK